MSTDTTAGTRSLVTVALTVVCIITIIFAPVPPELAIAIAGFGLGWCACDILVTWSGRRARNGR